jgi:hypothetical protein
MDKSENRPSTPAETVSECKRIIAMLEAQQSARKASGGRY